MFVLREAQALGLCGVVRNLPNGNVEVCAEGERSALEQLMAKLRAGPRGADVRDVAVDWLDYTHEHDDFSIAYD